MSKIPLISGKTAIKAFIKMGYQVTRQTGSHFRLIHPEMGELKPLTIPNHKTLGKGLVRKLLRDSNINLDKFIGLL